MATGAASPSDPGQCGSGPVALAFSSSGLLFPYHMGVIEALLEHQPPLDVSEVHGVSGGALAGAIAILGQESLEKVRKALETRIRPTWGEVWDPAVLIPRLIREHDIIPEDACARLSGRLHIYTTVGGMMKNTQKNARNVFKSNDELLTWLQASCSFAFEGVDIDGVPHWDGGCCGSWIERSEALPTIAASVVWKSDADICPKPGAIGFNAWGFRMDWPSVRAGWDCCFMFSPQRMQWYWQQGRQDAEAFLQSYRAAGRGPFFGA
eukprot:CAMPEP_0179108898 /NCGR_PEP_ID=MMETSP0796-20121207/50744_1 /TAXON_ID=73915 /ORGANISM="Pyrodinium bahamense, Strain pbaha01" /LENGTH=264 /DNA_ID=CAMNT_0020806977 /DNA_START=29 /DNA_END=820 /DNA_ORIENTATION=-